MTDLSHWDFAQTFSGIDAAALILGLDPAFDNFAKTTPLLKRMNDSYTATLLAFKDDYILRNEYLTESGVDRIFGKERSIIRHMINEAANSVFKPSHLVSYRMMASFTELESCGLYKSELLEMAEERFKRWCFDELRNGFEHQLFERAELQRWLEEVGFQSVYDFGRIAKEVDSKSIISKRILHLIPKRRDLLKPVIELAQSKCRDQWDVAEVWAKLRSLAIAKHSPLIGMDQDGIQYFDEKDSLSNLNLKALRMRLARSRL